VRVGVGNGVEADDFRRRSAQVPGDLFDLRLIDRHYGVPAAIGTCGTVHVLLYFASQDLKLRVDVVVRREVAAKGEVLFHLRGSEPKNFSQIGNHALRIFPGRRDGNLLRLANHKIFTLLIRLQR